MWTQIRFHRVKSSWCEYIHRVSTTAHMYERRSSLFVPIKKNSYHILLNIQYTNYFFKTYNKIDTKLLKQLPF